MYFEQKLGILKGQRLIKEGDWHKLMSIKWDRNIGGHPKSLNEIRKTNKDAESIIFLAINQIINISNKMKKY